ncbi:blue-light-activated protein [mine drainage metagenome]|uniref:Blue-light-activated protein n=1 Tax=mine drainage metagenome TaxID=410659 RepID=A0A1J5PR70_9ZZZZ
MRKDGSRFWGAAIINPILDHTGELIGFANITRDLTARQAAEDELRRSEQQFRRLVQSVTDYAIFLLDPQGRVSSWNSGAQKIKGYRPNEIIGRHFGVFYTADDQQQGEPARALDLAVQNGKYEKEGWRVRKNGDVFWANVVIDPVYDEDGSLVGFAKVTRDMTDAKKAQIEVERTREALLQSQKMEAVGQLTGGVAHDFNNLLTAILGGLEIVQRRLRPDANIAPLLENAIQAALRGRALTQRMLAFARRQNLKPEAVEVSALVRGMTDLLQRTLGPLVAIQTDLPAGLDTVMADENHLELAILNLAMNARDATVDGGTIRIAARAADAAGDKSGHRKFVCLSVTDDGAGMDAATLSRAMEPFFTTKDVGKGTGLGLSMVHGFAQQSGGYLTIESQPGIGTVA